MKNFLSLKDAVEAVISDENDMDTAVIIPPDADGGLTDGEGDEEVSGTLELTSSRRVRNKLEGSGDKEDLQGCSAQPISKRRRPNKGIQSQRTWSPNDGLIESLDEELPSVERQYLLLCDKSALNIFRLFFDESVVALFLEQTNNYARHENMHNFEMTEELWKFIIILTISCYNERPQYRMYWGKEEDIKCELIAHLFCRNRFNLLKTLLHVCNNSELDLSD